MVAAVAIPVAFYFHDTVGLTLLMKMTLILTFRQNQNHLLNQTVPLFKTKKFILMYTITNFQTVASAI